MEDVLLPLICTGFGVFLIVRRRQLATGQIASRNRVWAALRSSKRYGRRDLTGFVRANLIVGAWAIVLGLWMLATGTDF